MFKNSYNHCIKTLLWYICVQCCFFLSHAVSESSTTYKQVKITEKMLSIDNNNARFAKKIHTWLQLHWYSGMNNSFLLNYTIVLLSASGLSAYEFWYLETGWLRQVVPLTWDLVYFERVYCTWIAQFNQDYNNAKIRAHLLEHPYFLFFQKKALKVG